MMEEKLVYRYHPYKLNFIDSLPKIMFDKMVRSEFPNGNLPYENITFKKPLPVKENHLSFYSIQKDEWYYRHVLTNNNLYDEQSSDGVGQINFESKVSYLGNEILIVDDFYNNPDEVRRQALKDHYNVWSAFSTLRTPRRSGQAVFERLSQIWKKKLYVPENVFTGTYKMNFEADTWKRNFIHADMVGDVAGVIFLNKEKGPGLNFYKHKESCYTSNHQINQCHIEKLNLFYDGFFEDRWKLINEVERKFNRLVLFCGDNFHREANFFGSSAENARLTQTFFMNEIDHVE